MQETCKIVGRGGNFKPSLCVRFRIRFSASRLKSSEALLGEVLGLSLPVSPHNCNQPLPRAALALVSEASHSPPFLHEP